jgi:hypothetical protein
VDPINIEDLFDVVDTVARLVGGPVAVEDADFRVLAYSTVPGQPNDEARRDAILNRRTPDRWLRWMDESGFRERLLASDDPVRLDIPWDTFLPRYIQPVRHGGQVVGFLWLMQGDGPLADDMARTARDAAGVLAVELARRSSVITQNPGGQMLRQFLGGALPASRVGVALGVDEAAVPTVVIAVDVAAGAGGAAADAVGGRAPAVRALATYADTHLRGALVGSVEQQIYLMQADASVVDSVAPALDHAAEYLARALRRPVRAAAGGVHRGLNAAAVSRTEADDTMRVLPNGSQPVTVGRFEQLRHAIVLHEVATVLRDRPTLTEGLLAPLDRHDTERGTDYVATLAAYLEEFGDVRRTAERLHLHVNSLRYRLRRLEEIARFDLSDSDLRVALQLVFATRRVVQR